MRVSLNYRNDRVARGPLTGQTFLVGLVIPDLKQSFFAEIATAVETNLVPAAGTERARGYRCAIEKHGLESRDEWIVDAGHEENSGCAAMQTLLELQARPDGVFCFNDPVAVGALRAILGAGLRVPQDIALVGVANMNYSDWLTVPISTVGYDTESIGTLAARRLLECMSAGQRAAPQEHLVRSTLIPRASSLKRTGP